MSTNQTSNSLPRADSSRKKKEVEVVFKRFDANGDGLISSVELTHVLNNLGSTASDAEVRRVMQEVDADRDGFISLEEFAAFYGPEEDAGGECPQLRDAFETYDRDRDGLISASELHLILSRLGEGYSVADSSDMIKTFDSDGDGFISFEEFKRMMAK